MYAFVDGAVDKNRRRDQGGAGFGGAGVVLVRTTADGITAYRVIGVPFWPHSLFITNNTMEVMAAKIACEICGDQGDLHLWSDSQYVKNMLTFGSSYRAEKNKELIDYARQYVARSGVYIHHCHGHTGFVWNELANLAARQAVVLKKGFDKTYACAVSRLCFRCKEFPCGDSNVNAFGLKTATLEDPKAYAGILSCDEFSGYSIEGLEDE